MQNRLPKKPFCWLVTTRRSTKAATSEIGPLRHFVATQQCGRFRSEVDIERFSVRADHAIDPKRSGNVDGFTLP